MNGAGERSHDAHHPRSARSVARTNAVRSCRAENGKCRGEIATPRLRGWTILGRTRADMDGQQGALRAACLHIRHEREPNTAALRADLFRESCQKSEWGDSIQRVTTS